MIEGSCADPSEMGLELGEGHFYRVEIGAVGWQKQKPTPIRLEQRRGLVAFVGGQVVEDDDGAGLKLGDEDLFDVGIKGVSIHRARDHPRCDDPFAGQARNQGLVSPSPKRGAPLETLAFQAPAMGPGHVCVGAGFVQKDQSLGIGPHDDLSFTPVAPGLAHRGLALFLSDQPFFYMCSRGGAAAHQCRLWSTSPREPPAMMIAVQPE